MKRLLIGAGLATATLAGTAEAQLIEEARIGVLNHNICVTDCKNADKEDGPDVELEVVFARPDVFKYILSPRPFVVVNINTADETSYAGFGVVWQWEFAQGWYFEPSVGYVVHNGTENNPYTTGTEEAAQYGRETLLLGSKDLFRTSFALSRDFGEDWGMQLIFEHLSHGQILGEGRNQGLDNLGVRFYKRF